ncbi:MAG: SDR family oxidoreductase [Rhizobiales bacterium]|nr:SDR family oxidoreductase [Hyphomicrobiales bacterium]
MPQPHLFVFGLGYTGLAFARAMRPAAASVAGTVRSPDKAAALRAEGIEAHVFDGREPGAGIAAALARASHVVVTVSQGEGGDPVLAAHGEDLRSAPDLAWLGYLSTVGVYGDHGGGWIDEETPPDPRIARTAARLGVEAAWRELGAARDVPVGIFRLAGIYGPGRNPLVKVAEGTAHRIVKPGQVFNRIHVADIAATLRAAIERPASRLYNVSDDEPAPPQDVVAYAAGLMGVAPPPEIPFDTAELSPMARSFYAGNRRIRNARIRTELGVALAYPTYRDGLGALWRDGTWRG